MFAPSFMACSELWYIFVCVCVCVRVKKTRNTKSGERWGDGREVESGREGGRRRGGMDASWKQQQQKKSAFSKCGRKRVFPAVKGNINKAAAATRLPTTVTK